MNKTIKVSPRADDIQPVTVQWYRTTEDIPFGVAWVLDEHGWRVRCNGLHQWVTMGVDGSYYPIDDPEYWCYIPTRVKE